MNRPILREVNHSYPQAHEVYGPAIYASTECLRRSAPTTGSALATSIVIIHSHIFTTKPASADAIDAEPSTPCLKLARFSPGADNLAEE